MEVTSYLNLPWHALYVNYKSEKKVSRELNQLGIETFLPLYTKVRISGNRKRKSQIPLISCYVFAKIPVNMRGQVYNISGVVKMIKSNNQPSVIPQNEIEVLKKITGLNNGLELTSENYFDIGQAVNVTYGPLTGLQGEIIQKRGKNRFLLKIHSLHQAFSTEIDGEFVEPMEKTHACV